MSAHSFAAAAAVSAAAFADSLAYNTAGVEYERAYAAKAAASLPDDLGFPKGVAEELQAAAATPSADDIDLALAVLTFVEAPPPHTPPVPSTSKACPSSEGRGRPFPRNGTLIGTRSGIVLHVDGAGVAMQIHLAPTESQTHVHYKSDEHTFFAGWPFALGLNLYETLRFAYPLRYEGPCTPLTSDSVRAQLTKGRDMRRAQEAGDTETYNRLLFGGDGRTPAEIETAWTAMHDALPLWAAWRDREAAAREVALDRDAEAAEDFMYEQRAAEDEGDPWNDLGGID